MRAENLYIGACADGRLALSGNFGNVDPEVFNALPEGDRLRAIGRALLNAGSFRGKGFDAAFDSFIGPTGEEGRGEAGPTAIDLLRELRPIVARSKDAALRNTYNAMLARYTRSKGSKALDGGVTPRRARLFEPAPERYSELQARYDRARMEAA